MPGDDRVDASWRALIQRAARDASRPRPGGVMAVLTCLETGAQAPVWVYPRPETPLGVPQ